MSKHTSRGSKWQSIRKQVLKRDEYRCAYCGNDANTVDHIIPKAAGGKDVMDNLVTACHRCNATKQDRTEARLNYVNRRWLNSL